MASKETKRLENTFKDYMNENKHHFSRIDSNNLEIENELNSIKDNVYDHLKKRCADQFSWLEKHATVYYNDLGINVHVNENPDGISADAILDDLHKCAKQNDHGLKEFFDRANARKNNIVKSNTNCINSCTFRSEDKTDKEMKTCIDKCFKSSFNDTDYLISEIKDKISDVKSKIKEQKIL